MPVTSTDWTCGTWLVTLNDGCVIAFQKCSIVNALGSSAPKSAASIGPPKLFTPASAYSANWIAVKSL